MNLCLSFLLLAGCLCNLCNGSVESSRKVDIFRKKIDYSHKPIIKTTRLDFGENKLIIRTKIINDSLLSGNLVLDFKVIQQQLQFYKNDTEKKTLLYNPQKIEISTVHVKKCTVLENVIYEVSILQGRHGWVYYIKGGGITGNQTEYSGLFTPEGQLVYYSYSTSRNKGILGVPNELKGNLDSTLNKYGIDLDLFLHPKQIISVEY